MICPECGTRLPEGEFKCHFCGHLLNCNLSNSISQQETILEKIKESSFKQEEILKKLSENSLNEDRKFLDKYIALLTLLALWVALIVYFSGYIDTIGKEIVDNAEIRAVIAVIMATLITGFYWLLSPFMIHTLIDTQKPFAGSIVEIVVLFIIYIASVIVNFSTIPVPYSVVTFFILTLIFGVAYRYLSQKSVILK